MSCCVDAQPSPFGGLSSGLFGGSAGGLPSLMSLLGRPGGGSSNAATHHAGTPAPPTAASRSLEPIRQGLATLETLTSAMGWLEPQDSKEADVELRESKADVDEDILPGPRFVVGQVRGRHARLFSDCVPMCVRMCLCV